MKKLISIDVFANFGMLKKPDTNEPVYLTFNMLHKPALLGILGAVTGESGFKEKGVLPDYFIKFQDLKISIQPLAHENGNFQKTMITYNNTTGMASKEQGGNLMVTEQTLIAPSYRCYFLFDLENEVHKRANENLLKYHAEFLPYLGKNDFSLWWENVQEYDYEKFEPQDSFHINSLFIKKTTVKEGREDKSDIPIWKMDFSKEEFMYFERLPIGYDEELYQYEYRPFVLTTFKMEKDYKIDNLYKLDNNEVIQIF